MAEWTLEPGLDFLNHGSFGACPRVVLDAQAELRARMERQPMQFLARDLERLLDEARAALGAFLGADPDDLAFVPNATSGVNTVLRSLLWQPGDEVVTTDHAYNACVNALRAVATVKIAHVPWPVSGPAQVVDAVLGAITPRTKLVLIDHVTSPTGLVFPVEEIVRRSPVDVLVDGAHAPGMLELHLQKLGAAYYTGNCHKWLCTPKGSAFLHVRRDKQSGLRPLTISHGANSPRTDRSRFRLEFDWTGTDDPTPYLCIPVALRELPFDEMRRRNHELAVAGRRVLLEKLRVPEPAPESMLGSLASVPLPDYEGPPPDLRWHPLQRKLLEKHRIEVPIMVFPALPKQLVRFAAQAYNSLAQVERLAQALIAEGCARG